LISEPHSDATREELHHFDLEGKPNVVDVNAYRLTPGQTIKIRMTY
jgi:hypothetical protein